MMGAFPANSFQDAHEFLVLLLGTMQCTSLQFNCSSVVRCNTCQETSSTPDDSIGISIAIDANATRSICDYIESYFCAEAIDYFCHPCQRNYPAVNPLAVPDIIMVQLKRFKWNGNRLEKVNSLVECPAAITFAADNFDLVATISHVGSVTTGHYVSFCKRRGLWFELNDRNVKRRNVSEIISRNTYIVFYLRNSSGSGGSG